MADRIDELFQEWHHLGGAVLVAESRPPASLRSTEEIVAESTAHCRESGRLMWVVLGWLLRNIDALDPEKLLRETQEVGDLSVLGVLCDAANARKPHVKLEDLMEACVPNPQVSPFFYRVARSPLASRLTAENALEVFRRWNYLCSELRYLEDAA